MRWTPANVMRYFLLLADASVFDVAKASFEEPPQLHKELLYCYWVGFVDFDFLGKSRGFPHFPLSHQKVKLFAGGQQQPRLDT